MPVAIEIDRERYLARWRGERVYLSAGEIRVVALLTSSTAAVPHERLLAARAPVRSITHPGKRSKDYVKRIRAKFRVIDPAFNAIKPDYGVGYRWVSR